MTLGGFTASLAQISTSIFFSLAFALSLFFHYFMQLKQTQRKSFKNAFIHNTVPDVITVKKSKYIHIEVKLRKI